MNRPIEIRGLTCYLKHEGESHCVMCVCDGESNSVVKAYASRRQKCLKENHRGDGRNSKQFIAVIEGLGSTTKRTCKKCLVVTRRFSIGTQPAGKLIECLGHLANF